MTRGVAWLWGASLPRRMVIASSSFDGQPQRAVIAGEVIAEGQDGTSQHPLSHALMVAIDAAAARDRRLWPNTSQTTPNASAALLAGVDPLLPGPAGSSPPSPLFGHEDRVAST